MKKVVLFVTAIALVIAIAATSILAESKTTEPGNANTGRVDGTVEATASSDLNKTLPNENAERIDETVEPNEESNAINAKITPEAEEALKQDEESKMDEKEFTIGTFADFGVMDWRNSLGSDMLVFPLSEYEELDESLQFLNNYDIYIPMDVYQSLRDSDGNDISLNSVLLGYVESMHKDIRSRIADGTMASSFKVGYTGLIHNVMQVVITWDQIFYAVADYYYGYSL